MRHPLKWCAIILAVAACDTPDAPDESMNAEAVSSSLGEEEASDTSELESSAELSGDSEGSGGFVAPDAGSACGTDCDIWKTGECDPGQKCTVIVCEVANNWDSTICRDIQGADQVGDPCTFTENNALIGLDSCAEGSICWNADPQTGIGTCMAFCSGSSDDPICPDGYTCSLEFGELFGGCIPA